MNYLFGKPVGLCRPLSTSPRDYFILGAYPSALHVFWQLPNGGLSIRAVAVDDEPEPFWNGLDEETQIDRWKASIQFSDRCGRVQPCNGLNGSSGRWVDDNVIKPLKFTRDQAWITDCLDIYFASKAITERFNDKPLQEILYSSNIIAPNLRPHPSEEEIVTEAITRHHGRLRAELSMAKPRVIITLGNAALRVLRRLCTHSDSPKTLSCNETYGNMVRGLIEGQEFAWYPLAHPAAPRTYQDAHEKWVCQR